MELSGKRSGLSGVRRESAEAEDSAGMSGEQILGSLGQAPGVQVVNNRLDEIVGGAVTTQVSGFHLVHMQGGERK